MEAPNTISKAPDSDPDIVDVEMCTVEGRTPQLGRKYRIRVGGMYFIFDHHLVTGREILEKSGNVPVECHTLYQKFRDCDFEKIDLNEKVDLAKPGIEHFVVKPPEVFYYTVDAEPETTDQKQLSPNQILELAGITPVNDYYLVQIKADGTQISYKDNPDTLIKMQCPAMRFVSAFRGGTPVS